MDAKQAAKQLDDYMMRGKLESGRLVHLLGDLWQVSHSLMGRSRDVVPEVRRITEAFIGHCFVRDSLLGDQTVFERHWFPLRQLLAEADVLDDKPEKRVEVIGSECGYHIDIDGELFIGYGHEFTRQRGLDCRSLATDMGLFVARQLGCPLYVEGALQKPQPSLGERIEKLRSLGEPETWCHPADVAHLKHYYWRMNECAATLEALVTKLEEAAR